ncbi:M23 family metallopeptidase [Pseudonocardia sp.]|uniref:M23 family metallopeptidase n=1 Tax=Pseudonocardia sp. TaxID=60912 RepID=UPI003D144FF0
MTRHVRRVAPAAALAAAVLIAGCAPSGQAPAASAAPEPGPPAYVEPVLTPVVGSVLYPPVPFTGEDGRTHLVHEVILTNYTPGTVSVDKVDVLDQDGKVIHTLTGADLAARVLPTSGKQYVNQLAAGQNAAVFLHVALDGTAPASLVHEVTVSVAGTPMVERLGATPVTHRRLPVLGPPLKGEGYVAADGCCDAVRHTRAILPVNGGSYLAQRYAIDYEQVDADQRIYVGDRLDPRSYHIFGDEALAVADATVVETMDGLSEQVPGTYPSGIPITEADGNFVVLDIGDGFYVNYAHLQPGSVRVKRGDTVRKGDVLGLVGNTGNSVAPHLHLHVMDAPSAIVAQGLPYLIDSFTVTGRSASTAAFDAAEAEGIPLATLPGFSPTDHANQMVLDQAVVTFGG